MEDNNALFKIISGGPVEVTGNFRILSSDGKILERDGPVFLCRCGGSANKPFCDNTHKRNGFSD